LLSRAAGRQHLSFLTELSGVLGKTLFKMLALFETVTLDDHELLRSLRARRERMAFSSPITATIRCGDGGKLLLVVYERHNKR
jgi:hypothetical protein